MFGKPEPIPCRCSDWTISLPEIFLGSTPFCHKDRCAIYTWPTGIDEDHVYLDNAETLDWQGVASCLRDLEAPTTGVSGDSPRSRPEAKFPAAVMLESVSALCNALVGRRKWTDRDVVEERDTLLWEDEEASRAYEESVQKKLVEAYCAAFVKLEKYE